MQPTRLPPSSPNFTARVPAKKMCYQGANLVDCEKHDPVKGEKAVWRAVIVQALMDAACLSKKRENQQHRDEALVWLRGNSVDFAEVCYHAGFDPDYVRSMVRGCLERGCQWRAAPGTGELKKRRDRKPTGRSANQRR